jgi:sugar (pentulose or hexulose) kinase
MALYLGLDAGAHTLTAIVIEINGASRRIAFEDTVTVDNESRVDALHRVVGKLATAAELDLDDLRAMSGAAEDQRQNLEAITTSLPWQMRYALPLPALVPWTDGLSAQLLGTGVIRPGMIGIGLGATDVVITNSPAPAMLRFRNGSIAREFIRLEHGLQWNQFAELLAAPPGSVGHLMLPWLEPEITPPVAHAGLRRFGFDRTDAGRNVRALIEGQMMAMANHLVEITADPIERIVATGAAAADHAILQVMANVFGADVYRFDRGNPVALGSALRAYQADVSAGNEAEWWEEVVGDFTDPNPGYRVAPNPRHVATYAALRREYAVLERLHQHRPPIY